jgi:hypothetical protein
MQLHWDSVLFNGFTYSELKYNYYPALQGMDSCTQANFLQDYFQAFARTSNLTEPSGAGIVTLGVLVWLVG